MKSKSTLIQDLQAMQRCIPEGTQAVTLDRAVFDEVVSMLAGSAKVRDWRLTVVDGLMPQLTPIESRIMQRLHDADGGTVASSQFQLKSKATLWVHIKRLREKIEHYRVEFRVETVRGRGYRLAWDVVPSPSVQ